MKMVEVCKNINDELKACLNDASEIWIAVAMMNNGGLSLFKDLDKKVLQNHIVGIDLPTPPKILKTLLNLSSDSFSAKIYETDYTYHPKLYIVQNFNGNYTAFVGSSNATHSGLKNNIELNLKITDNSRCLELLRWFRVIDQDAKLITEEIISEYSKHYKTIKRKARRIDSEVSKVKLEIERLDQQFFSSNHHAVFHSKYSKLKNLTIRRERDKVREQMIKLHNRIYPRFNEFNITNLYTTARGQERTSKHYPNPYSGKSIRSVWLHYGKSPKQLEKYKTREERSFINHARIQVIIHNDSVGTWLVLGKNWGSEIDRINFRREMRNDKVKKKFFKQLKKLDESYWLRYDEGRGVKITDLNSIEDFSDVISKETLGEYFIIGKDYDSDDPLLSDKLIDNTILEQFSLLYPLYEIMID